MGTSRSRRGPLPWLNPGLVAGALVPLASILLRARSGGLGANPIAEALNELGLTALILLVASPARARRTLGLLAFLYAALHVTCYAALDQGFDFGAMAQDVSKRPFIFVGFAAFVLLVPLALTSTRRSVRRLGYVAWSRLHTLVYPAALLAGLHFIWRVKKDLREPLFYAGERKPFVFVVNEGIVKMAYETPNGNSWIKGFAEAGMCFASLNALEENGRTSFSAYSVVESCIHQVDYRALLRLAEKAFWPARIPFPVMHVDTGLNFPEVIAFRDRRVEELKVELVVASVPEAIERGLVQPEPNGSRNRIQTPVLLEAVRQLDIPNLVVVSPDAGGVERARAIAKRMSAGLAIIDKRRTAPNEAEVMHLIGDVAGCNALIVDDIIDTAGTLTKTVEALKKEGADRVLAAGVHGILSGPALQRIEDSCLETVLITNTTPVDEKLARLPKLPPATR